MRRRSFASTVAAGLGTVATDAVLTKAQARKFAQQSHDGLARAIEPAHTLWDGDTMFALATGQSGLPGNMLALGVMAAHGISGPGLPTIPAASDLP